VKRGGSRSVRVVQEGQKRNLFEIAGNKEKEEKKKKGKKSVNNKVKGRGETK